jgi:hypothetical protein
MLLRTIETPLVPAHKLQHYVPRSHLRPFSASGEGRSINLYHITSDQLIQRAPVRGQCAKEYFYGDDLRIEKALQPIEGGYADAVKSLEAKGSVTIDQLKLFRDFTYLQYLRTDIAARRLELQHAAMSDLIFDRAQSAPVGFVPSREEVVNESIKVFVDTVDLLSDLKACIFRNETDLPFITSDDPAIQLNRFYMQSLGTDFGSAGMINAGLQLFLPLTPKYCFCSYDGDVYTIPGKAHGIVRLVKRDDVTAINVQQYIKSSQCIYFKDWLTGPRLRKEFLEFAPRRPSSWHKVHYAVRDDSQLGGTHKRYRVVHTKAEREEAREALLHLEGTMLAPGIWCTALKFRDKLRFVDTRSGAGYLRRSTGSGLR